MSEAINSAPPTAAPSVAAMDAPPAHKPTKYPRFDRYQRIEHATLLASFTILAITGLPQKYSAQPWANAMIGAVGGIENIRLIHHVAAIVLLVGAIYHFIAVSYKVLVKRVALTMLPGWQDVKDGIQALGHNIGAIGAPPRMGRFTFGEKVEYWAVVWGTVVMAITGFMLWNPIATATFFPGQFIPASKAAHGGEALLAVLSIVTWHLYHVHVKQFNKSMFSGEISHHAMQEEHPLELQQIETGRTRPAPSPATLRRRRRVFVPVAAVLSLLLVGGLFLFVTYEQTAITTVPRQAIEVFAPITPTVMPGQ